LRLVAGLAFFPGEGERLVAGVVFFPGEGERPFFTFVGLLLGLLTLVDSSAFKDFSWTTSFSLRLDTGVVFFPGEGELLGAGVVFFPEAGERPLGLLTLVDSLAFKDSSWTISFSLRLGAGLVFFPVEGELFGAGVVFFPGEGDRPFFTFTGLLGLFTLVDSSAFKDFSWTISFLGAGLVLFPGEGERPFFTFMVFF
jgi:hypothetical protein